MEIDRKIIQEDEEGSSHGKDISTHGADGSVLQQARLQECTVSREVFDADEDENEDAKQDEAGNDTAIRPLLGSASPLHCQQVANDRGHQCECAGEVHLKKLLFHSRLLGPGSLGCLEEQEDNGGGDSADGQIDVEAPSPGEIVREDTS